VTYGGKVKEREREMENMIERDRKRGKDPSLRGAN
jgi:hypothetical protein